MNLDIFDRIKTAFVKFGYVWSSPESFIPIEQVWSNLGIFDPIWTSLVLGWWVGTNLDKLDQNPAEFLKPAGPVPQLRIEDITL